MKWKRYGMGVGMIFEMGMGMGIGVQQVTSEGDDTNLIANNVSSDMSECVKSSL